VSTEAGRPGRVIAVEGIDGAGTTTLAAGLVEHLRCTGLQVRSVSQPTDQPSGKVIRSLLAESSGGAGHAAALALAFAADRLMLWDRMAPALAAGEWVVTDRSVMSSLVYQASELPPDWVEHINRYAPRSDLTLLLDLSAETAMARIGRRDGLRERYEKEALLADFAARYRALDSDRFGAPVVLIDAAAPPEQVLAATVAAIAERGWTGG
jgi:dTMP kinase